WFRLPGTLRRTLLTFALRQPGPQRLVQLLRIRPARVRDTRDHRGVGRKGTAGAITMHRGPAHECPASQFLITVTTAVLHLPEKIAENGSRVRPVHDEPPSHIAGCRLEYGTSLPHSDDSPGQPGDHGNSLHALQQAVHEAGPVGRSVMGEVDAPVVRCAAL